MEYHLEDRLSARVGRQPGEGRDCERTHRSQRIVVRLAACLDQHGVEWQSCAFAHCAEQIGFVFEMPVDRTARYAGSGRDLGEGCFCDSMVAEYPLGGVEQLFARDGGLNFGLADHADLPAPSFYKQ